MDIKKSTIKAICIIASMFLFTHVYAQKAEQDSTALLQLGKFAEAYQLIHEMYVDTVDYNQITEAALMAMLKSLDPHSAYMSLKQSKASLEDLKGEFEGVGIQFQIIQDTIVVIAPIAGGPSEKVGVMAGDKIIKVDNENAVGEHVNIDWVRKMLRGPKNSKVEVEIFRRTVTEPFTVTIIRDVIPIVSVDAFYMVKDDIGYVKLNKFARNSKKEMSEALEYLKEQGMKKLILDLRNNTGGYLDVAVNITNDFIAGRQMIVYTEGRKTQKNSFYSNDSGAFTEGELVVLINEGSASGSEILAGAVQDLDRGTLIGRRTFGKGLVQRQYFLKDSSEIRLTIARYYTPSGRCIQKPYEKGTDEYRKDIEYRMEHGEMFSIDSIQLPDSLKYKTQKGRTVYGGGGIMPDIFVPMDTTSYSDIYLELISKGVLNSFALEYIDENRKKLEKEYLSSEEFVENFIISKEILNLLSEKAEADGIKIDSLMLDRGLSLIQAQLKALIASKLFGFGAYYKIINPLRAEYNEAVKFLINK